MVISSNREIERTLAALGNLGPDWDSYGGDPPTDETIARARLFIDALLNMRPRLGKRIEPTSLSPLATGGIDIEWRRPEHLVSVEVASDGTWGFLVRSGTGKDARYTEESNLSMEAVIARVLSAMFPTMFA